MDHQQFKKKDNPTLEEERSSSIPVATPTLLTSSSMLRPTLKASQKLVSRSKACRFTGMSHFSMETMTPSGSTRKEERKAMFSSAL